MAAYIGRGVFKTLGNLRRPLLLSRSYSSSGRPWNVGKLNHVAIAVPNLEGQTKFYKDVLGAKVSEPMDLPEHGVSVVFIELGDTKLELLQPLGEKSPIAGYLKKKPQGGMHHICIEVNPLPCGLRLPCQKDVDNIAEALKTLSANNIKAIDPEPKIGAHGKPVVFLHPKDCGGVLTELEQS